MRLPARSDDHARRAGTGVHDYTVIMLIFSALGVVAVVMAVGLEPADRGPDSHGLELPSAEAAALNETRWSSSARADTT